MIEPFDLILFYGGDLPAKIISKAQRFHMEYMGYEIPPTFNPEWSHVGVAITTDWLDIENGEKDTIYVWESTYSGHLEGIHKKKAFDVESGKGMLGVQIRKLDDVIPAYLKSSKQRIAVLKLKPVFHQILKHEMEILKPKIQRLHRDNYHRDYDASISLVAAVVPLLRKFRSKKDKRLFCSELAAKIYKCVGLLDQHIDPANVIPSDFAYPNLSEEKFTIFEYPWIELHVVPKREETLP